MNNARPVSKKKKKKGERMEKGEGAQRGVREKERERESRTSGTTSCDGSLTVSKPLYFFHHSLFSIFPQITSLHLTPSSFLSGEALLVLLLLLPLLLLLFGSPQPNSLPLAGTPCMFMQMR